MNKVEQMATYIPYLILQGMSQFRDVGQLYKLERESINLGFIECALPSFKKGLEDAIIRNEKDFPAHVKLAITTELREGTYLERQTLDYYLEAIDNWFDGYELATAFIKEIFIVVSQKEESDKECFVSCECGCGKCRTYYEFKECPHQAAERSPQCCYGDETCIIERTCGDCSNFDLYKNEREGYGGCDEKHGTVHRDDSASDCSDFQ